MTKHFFKTLILFAGLIAVGMLGVFLVNYYGFGEGAGNTDASVAK